MPNYGLLAQQGRREDNAAMGGQVAHISAVESELLRLLGGAGTTNPATGLPEYYGPAPSYSTSTSTGYGGPGPAPGAKGSAGALAAKLFNFNLSPDGPTPVTSDMMTHLQKTGKDSYVKNAFDHFADNVFNLFSKISPTMLAINLAKSLFSKGEGEGEGDSQTQTVATPSISPTYAPTMGSISPALAQVIAIAESTPEEETEVAEGELYDLGFPESPLLAGQRVFDAELTRTKSPENLAQYDLGIPDVLTKYVAAQLLKQAQTQGQLA
jgi:hypothetical protein